MLDAMRTTLDLDLDVLMAAKEIASARRQTAGQVISELVRKALAAPRDDARVRNGVPLLARRPGKALTLAEVNRLRDD